jgi:hypothetical protein
MMLWNTEIDIEEHIRNMMRTYNDVAKLGAWATKSIGIVPR